MLSEAKKGVSGKLLMILAVIIAMVITLFFGIESVSTLVDELGMSAGCRMICQYKPEDALKKGCWCGTAKESGKYLHIVGEKGSPNTLYAFHVSYLDLNEISDYSVSDAVDLTDDCDDRSGVNLLVWKSQAKEEDGCEVYVVNKKPDPDTCALYTVDEGEKIKGISGETVWGEIGRWTELNSSSGNPEKILESFKFDDQIIKLGRGSMIGQKYLLDDPYGTGTVKSSFGGEANFTLWNEVNCSKIAGEFKWRIAR